jgi:hypothetical protein
MEIFWGYFYEEKAPKQYKHLALNPTNKKQFRIFFLWLAMQAFRDDILILDED